VITMEKAALWTDGRYFLQASKQLDSDWTLMKAGLPETESKEKWLSGQLVSSKRVGVDSALISYEAAKRLKETLGNNGIELVAMGENLIDAIWTDQPKFEPKPIDFLPLEFSGRSMESKISELRCQLRQKKHSSILITALDEIACKFCLCVVLYMCLLFIFRVVQLEG
jgi:Xaa-Pro aminopeptidase